MVWGYFEDLITHLPMIRNVYGAAKQLTDYMLTEKPLEFKRVVAFEHPARAWQIGFVAGEGFAEIRKLAGEPVLAVLVHVNPIPVSGYVRLVPKSQIMDLDMTVDQAVHYIVSFGVVLPPQQLPKKPAIAHGVGNALRATNSSIPCKVRRFRWSSRFSVLRASTLKRELQRSFRLGRAVAFRGRRQAPRPARVSRGQHRCRRIPYRQPGSCIPA